MYIDRTFSASNKAFLAASGSNQRLEGLRDLLEIGTNNALQSVRDIMGIENSTVIIEPPIKVNGVCITKLEPTIV